MAQSKVIVVGRLASITLLGEIVERMRGLGHQVDFYEDSHAFHQARDGLADTNILLAAPSFVCTRALMAAAPRLRGLVSPITGIEGFDIKAATDLGILVANGQVRENVEGMAEATILLVLAMLYDLHGTEAVLRQNLARPARMSARMFSGKVLGMIGFGQIARSITTRLDGWGVTIQVNTRRVPNDAPEHVRFVELDDLLRTSDVVCVLAGLNSDTKGMLNAARLRLLKQGAVLVNTARGAIIDEAALADIARERPDVRLALDTFTTEPLPPQSPLRDLSNTILTPHMLGHTQEAQAALPDAAVENVGRILAGQVPRYVCNPGVIPQWQARWRSVSA